MLLVCAALVHAMGVMVVGSPVDFNRDIRPLLSDRCFQCHGPDASTREAGLRLDEELAAKRDRGGYAAVVPGDAGHSELIRRITSEDDNEKMPPPHLGKPLAAAEVELLKRWVDEGAQWSKAWAYVPPQRHAVPDELDRPFRTRPPVA